MSHSDEVSKLPKDFKVIASSNNSKLAAIENSKKKILDKVELNISKFSTVGLMGKTGSGKSTLANILIGLLSF